jgi:hypothetical protein
MSFEHAASVANRPDTGHKCATLAFASRGIGETIGIKLYVYGLAVCYCKPDLRERDFFY